MEAGKGYYVAKTDLKSAFRQLPIRKENWCWLVMKAVCPDDGKTYYFFDKCTPFGSSISCSHFQRFSDSLEAIFFYRTGHHANNYLDDFLFATYLKNVCNDLVNNFYSCVSRFIFQYLRKKLAGRHK